MQELHFFVQCDRDCFKASIGIRRVQSRINHTMILEEIDRMSMWCKSNSLYLTLLSIHIYILALAYLLTKSHRVVFVVDDLRTSISANIHLCIYLRIKKRIKSRVRSITRRADKLRGYISSSKISTASRTISIFLGNFPGQLLNYRR